MSKERDFCTLLDRVGEKSSDVLKLLTDHCLTSVLTNPRSKHSFLMPSKKALTKIKKLSKAKQVEQLKLHILSYVIDPEKSFKDRSQLSSPTLVKGVRLDVTPGKGKTSITVENHQAKLIATARNGNLFETDDLMPMKEPVASASRSRSRSSSRKGKRKQRGGRSAPHSLTIDIQDRLGYLSSAYNKWGMNYPIGPTQESWAARALAPLIMYLNQNLGASLKDELLPFLGTDPLATLELLLQIRGSQFDPTMPIIQPSLWSGFKSSPYWLSDEEDLLYEARNLMASWCTAMGNVGSCDYDTYHIQDNFVKQQRNYIKELIYQTPQRAREEIMSVYRKLGDINRYSPGQTALFRKVWQNPQEGLLYNDLIRYMSSRFGSLPFSQYNSYMQTVFPPNVSITSVLENIFEPGKKDLNLSGYTFPNDIIIDWVDSECFLHCFPVDMHSEDHFGYMPFSGFDPAIIESVRQTSWDMPGWSGSTSTVSGNFLPNLRMSDLL